MRRWAGLVASVALALALAGCGDGVVTRDPTAGPPTVGGTELPAGAPGGAATANLRAEKRAADIADCPRSESDVPAVTGGLPDVVLPCLGGGRPVRLAGLRRRPMIINVWGQWCGPCREEAPFLAEVARSDQTTVTIVGIDSGDPRPELAVEFARYAGWHYPQLQDAEQALAAPMQLSALPITFFVRADGTIAYRNAIPFRSADQIRQLAQQHLGVRL